MVVYNQVWGCNHWCVVVVVLSYAIYNMLLLLGKRRVIGSDERTSDLFGAQMWGLEVQMLGPSSYEEPLLSWYHVHIKSRCCHIEYKFSFVNLWFSCEYIIRWWLLILLFMLSFCTTNIFECILTPLLFCLYVDVRLVKILRNKSSSCCELEDGLEAYLHLLYHLSLLVS